MMRKGHSVQTSAKEKAKSSLEGADMGPMLMSASTHTWNPLKKLPRNMKCPCLSGKKFKTCCMIKLPTLVTKEAAARYRAQMAKPDLVFVTAENRELLAQMEQRATEKTAQNQ